ncbi:pantoate--beta-alanine ligase [Bacillus halotolerans]|uniref:Pantothenate synthetase n=1 Tax=Bacillus halotolerans TaxID=260554 RepID=A0ABY7HVI8_9BACI|nr:pantoate--beta-alanine ligase [Bacillus halotolerans]MBV5122490.1 pantoate--beta-alanine ligase [Bacillus halotolerans]MCC2116454.1 pantoate--beta-alanine ligase [Bacillus halotolerans]MDG0767102.1 pantoate--beta-alanine ligase [Bacillus halotolerans]UUI82709.1 pantoate--beta-alanine ligase [Bacillus halotolerans]UYO30416.1 pantoate--beta-alanine ligase [Bacillus halotolerans]
MKQITDISQLKEIITQYQSEGKTIGFVPTMGFLHEGHLTLADKARQENDAVVMSIFVNPTQFGPGEDFEAYPRDLERDAALAENAGVDILFTPDASDMYPGEKNVTIHVERRTEVLCGRSRKGHFDGVAIVLTKLFNLVKPTRAYFGLKDAQQVAVVDGLISDFFMDIELVAVDTVREEDGLAKSSRNVYLTAEERREAPKLYQALQTSAELIRAGERNPEAVINAAKDIIETTSGRIDYVELYSYPELEPVNKLEGKIILAVAVAFSKARLIDNIIIDIREMERI